MRTRRTPWRQNELRRTSDRIEAWCTFLVVMTALLVVPWTAWWCAQQLYRDAAQAEARERQQRLPAVAVLLEAPSGQYAQAGDAESPPTVPVRATWIGPDGVTRTGTVVADADERAGGHVPIWVDQHGELTGPPRSRTPVLTAVLVALLVAAGLTGGFTGVHRIVVWRLDRRRMRDWQAEWLVVEPRWTNR
ncbi:MAG TPA: hypothetical protein VFH03_23745 [Actinoplanes sp.]|nr:hypothetical protein [Actinoplanes sp.]